MFKIRKLQALPGYRLKIEFVDGTSGIADVSHLLGKGIFSAWDDHRFFEKVFIGPSGEPRWNDQIDLDPDSLYLKVTGKSPEEVFPALKSEASHA